MGVPMCEESLSLNQLKRCSFKSSKLNTFMNDPHRNTPIARLGCDLSRAEIAIVLLHGRGSAAQDILQLVPKLFDERIAYLSPQAADGSWFPHSFLAPLEQNEPWLSSGLAKIQSMVQMCADAGLPHQKMIVAGFSQGACLATEFVARHPSRYRALIAFTGGLIGPPGADLLHQGSLKGTPVLFSSGDPDPNIPWARVERSGRELERMGARVQLNRYPGRLHTILNEELQAAREIIFPLLS